MIIQWPEIVQQLQVSKVSSHLVEELKKAKKGRISVCNPNLTCRIHCHPLNSLMSTKFRLLLKESGKACHILTNTYLVQQRVTNCSPTAGSGAGKKMPQEQKPLIVLPSVNVSSPLLKTFSLDQNSQTRRIGLRNATLSMTAKQNLYFHFLKYKIKRTTTEGS